MDLVRFGPRASVAAAVNGDAINIRLSSGRAATTLVVHEHPATLLAGLLAKLTKGAARAVPPPRRPDDRLRRALGRVDELDPVAADVLRAALERAGYVDV